MELDFSRCRLPPFKHQAEDVATMVRLPFLFIASEMRTGKTKIVIDAAQFLYLTGVIDRVLVVAPSPVRDVWFDHQMGEIAKHSFEGLPMVSTEFHSSTRLWWKPEKDPSIPYQSDALQWIVTNYEFIRSRQRLNQLLPFCTTKTLLVLDESMYVKNYDSAQTKACGELRQKCGRVVLLNGTPIFHSPLDLFSQGNLLHHSILNCRYITHFKARFGAVLEVVKGEGGKALTDPRGNPITTVTGWSEQGLVELQRLFGPYTIRRLQAECLDLPPKLDPVTLTATLKPTPTWKAYKEMRDQMVVWLESGNVATSSTAAIKSIRLSQITSGFLAGIEDAGIDEVSPQEPGLLESLDLGGLDASISAASDDFGLGDWGNPGDPVDLTVPAPVNTIQEIGREKLDVLLWFLGQKLAADPFFHVVVWCRWRAEVERMLEEVKREFPQFIVGAMHGGQKKAERMEAMRLLHPDTSPRDRPVFIGGTEQTGSFGLNFTAAHTSIDMSAGYSPGRQAQKNDRVYGPGQTEPIAYYDIVAVGPKGQKTIDHTIIAARRAGESVANYTVAAWVKALKGE